MASTCVQMSGFLCEYENYNLLTHAQECTQTEDFISCKYTHAYQQLLMLVQDLQPAYTGV